jgi:membrane associated rhomboid family serine protease
MGRPLSQRLTFGGRVPWVIGLIVVLIVVMSLTAAFVTRHGTSLFGYGALSPSLVWRGQLWRLITWPFLQPGPFNFIITLLMIYWWGIEVAVEWGSRWFLKVFGVLLLLSGVMTCLIAKVDPAVMAANYLGSFALTAAMVVAWGLTFPNRVIRLFFILRIRGLWVAWLTVGISVVYAVYSGWTQYLPELLAEAFILAYLYRDELSESFTKKRAVSQRRRERSRKRATSVAYLKLVDRREDELPELPADIARKLRTKRDD